MKKKCFKLEQYIERVYCDDCGTELVASELRAGVDNLHMLREYICPKCGKIEYSDADVCYPQLIKKEVECGHEL